MDNANPLDGQYLDLPLTLPKDPLAEKRVALQRKYGFEPVPQDFFDELAQEIREHLHIKPDRGIAGVNHLDERRKQKFVGVSGAAMRDMDCEQGACSTLIARDTVKGRTALAMGNLMDFPLFATNDMVTKFDMRTYLGAQIMAPEGIPIGTVWWIDTEPRRYLQGDLEFMKAQARKAMQHLIDHAPQR